ncbi:hypothetical protein [Streptomyces albogriseolus]|uniref:hypothetical protein n=1 Tax=Streptomyces albogriseolus TaxID=1887 RepID=UPI00382DAC70
MDDVREVQGGGGGYRGDGEGAAGRRAALMLVYHRAQTSLGGITLERHPGLVWS